MCGNKKIELLLLSQCPFEVGKLERFFTSFPICSRVLNVVIIIYVHFVCFCFCGLIFHCQHTQKEKKIKDVHVFFCTWTFFSSRLLSSVDSLHESQQVFCSKVLSARQSCPLNDQNIFQLIQPFCVKVRILHSYWKII